MYYAAKAVLGKGRVRAEEFIELNSCIGEEKRSQSIISASSLRNLYLTQSCKDFLFFSRNFTIKNFFFISIIQFKLIFIWFEICIKVVSLSLSRTYRYSIVPASFVGNTILLLLYVFVKNLAHICIGLLLESLFYYICFIPIARCLYYCIFMVNFEIR